MRLSPPPFLLALFTAALLSPGCSRNAEEDFGTFRPVPGSGAPAAGGAKSVRILPGHPDDVTCVAFSPDSRLIVTGCQDGDARVWGAWEGVEPLRTLTCRAAPVQAAAFSPGGAALATAGYRDAKVRIWNADTGNLVHTLRGPEELVSALSFSADSRRHVGGGGDRSIRIWETANWNPTQLLPDVDSWVYALALSPDGKRLAAGGSDKRLKIWNLESRRLERAYEEEPAMIKSVAFSPDGTAVAYDSGAVVRIRDLKTGLVKRALGGHRGMVRAVAFSPDGATLVTGAADGMVRLWDPGSGASRMVLRGHSAPVSCVAFSPDGRLIASGGEETLARIWEIG